MPDYIGKGIGNDLLGLGEKYIKEKKARDYFIFVHKENKLGKNFYKKKGFIHMPDKDKEDEFYMKKHLM